MNTNQIKQLAATFCCAAMVFAVGCSKDAGVEEITQQGGSLVGDAPTLFASVVQPSTKVSSAEGTDCIEFTWEVEDVVSIYTSSDEIETKVADYSVTEVDGSGVATLEYVSGSATIRDLDLSTGSYIAKYSGANVGATLAYDATTSYIGEAIELSTDAFSFSDTSAVTFSHDTAFLGVTLKLADMLSEALSTTLEDTDTTPIYVCVSNTTTTSYSAISLLYSDFVDKSVTVTLPVAAESWDGIYVALAADAAATTTYSTSSTTLTSSVTFEAGSRKVYENTIELALPSVLTCETTSYTGIDAGGVSGENAIEVTFTSNGEWSVTTEATDMITLPATTTGTATPDLGTEQTISIEIAANDDADPRSGSITISQDGATDITITFFQNAEGGDSADNPIVLTKEKLLALVSGVNDGTVSTTDVYYKLEDNIDLENEEWTPLGNSETYPFAGHLDGNGKTISGLSITSDIRYAGFIGVMKTGSISNLTVKGAIDITSTALTGVVYVGGIIAYTPVDVTGVSMIGDLVAEVNVDYTYASTNSYIDRDFNIGGAFGLFSCSKTSTSDTTTITSGAADGSNYVNVDVYSDIIRVGGVMGTISSDRTNNGANITPTSKVKLTSNVSVTSHCYPTADITAAMNAHTGGVVGYVTFTGMDNWRAVMKGSKVHTIVSPCDDSSTAIRWICTGGFSGYVNAVNGFRYSTSADLSSSTNIITELDDSAIGSGTMYGDVSDPYYKLCVGTYTGQKSANVGTSATWNENKDPNGTGGIGTSINYRANNYFKLYNEATVMNMLSNNFQMSHSGTKIASDNWSTYVHIYSVE